jgi:hypothetical protein
MELATRVARHTEGKSNGAHPTAIADRERRSFSFVVGELLIKGLEATEAQDEGKE